MEGTLHFSCSSVAQLCLTLCNPMDCSMPGFPPSPSPGVCWNSCPFSRWCHPTILSSVIPFSSCLQSFPASGSFPMSQFLTSGGQRTGVPALASFLPKNTQGWSPLERIGYQYNYWSFPFSKYCVQFSRSIVSNFLWSHRLQHARPPCPSPIPEFTKTHV